MAYNLRPRCIRDELLQNAESDEEIVEQSDAVISSSDSEGFSCASAAEETDEDIEMEDVSLNERLNQSRARGRPATKLRGKNGFVWNTTFSTRRSDRQSDILPEIVPRPAGNALHANTIEEFWSCLFDKKMIDIVVENTNKKIEEECLLLVTENREESYHYHTDEIEMKAYIGVLYYTGLWKSSKVNDNRLWDKKNGITFYRCMFSRSRFTFLTNCLRFDDKDTRDKDDGFAPIRSLWSIFIENCKNNYAPSSRCTVDEQLLSFRGRCAFRVYMKDKPDKYGLKIISLNDAETSYMIYAVPYLGKNTEIVQRDEAIPEYYFRLVTEPIYNSNRSVTCDNWYTSIPLLLRMFKEPFNIKVTGTLRKNKREIPAEFIVAPKERPTTKFAHTKDLTLLSFAPKKKNNKVVIIVSSFMHTNKVTNGKSDIVRYYNLNKGGTDTFDKLCHSYSVTGRTTRWPMRYFFGILDQAIVNSRILLTCKLKIDGSSEKVTAIDCLEKLHMHLVTPHIQNRYAIVTLRKDIRLGIAGILQLDVERSHCLVNVELRQPQRCVSCTRKQDKKSRKACASCHRPICRDHSFIICDDCSGK